MSTLDVIEKILVISFSILNLYILYLILKNFLGFKVKAQYVVIAMLITANIPFLIVQKLNIESVYQWIPTAINIFVLSLIFCKGTYLKKIIFTIIYTCFNELFQYLTVPIIYMSNNIVIFNSTYKTEQIIGIANQVFLIFLQLVCILALNIIIKNCYLQDSFKDIKYMIFFVVPNVFIVTLLCEYFKLYYKNINDHISIFSNIKMMGFAITALFCAILTVISLDRLIKENALRQRELLLSQQFDLQANHYKDLQIQFKNTQAFKHDINNHLICIKNLISSGDINNTEEYLSKITETIERLNLKVNTGNPFADAVISEKYNISIDKNIEFKCNVKIPDRIKVDSFDLCVILGNALDNAIAACEKITDESIKKYIHIESMSNKSFIIFEIKNSMQGYININNIGNDKGDYVNKGLGLLNIQSIANKYLGTTYIENSENMFVLNIML